MTHHIAAPLTAAALTALAEYADLDTTDLMELVDEVASYAGTEANNGGISAQIHYLNEHLGPRGAQEALERVLLSRLDHTCGDLYNRFFALRTHLEYPGSDTGWQRCINDIAAAMTALLRDLGPVTSLLTHSDSARARLLRRLHTALGSAVNASPITTEGPQQQLALPPHSAPHPTTATPERRKQ